MTRSSLAESGRADTAVTTRQPSATASPSRPATRSPFARSSRSHTDLLAESDEGKEDIAKDIGNCGEMLSQLGERLPPPSRFPTA